MSKDKSVNRNNDLPDTQNEDFDASDTQSEDFENQENAIEEEETLSETEVIRRDFQGRVDKLETKLGEAIAAQGQSMKDDFKQMMAQVSSQQTPVNAKPEVPFDYDANEALERGTPSYNYHQQMKRYEDTQKTEKEVALTSRIDSLEGQLKAQTVKEEFGIKKAQLINEMVGLNDPELGEVSIEEASRTFDMFSDTSKMGLKDFIKAGRAINAKPKAKTTKKVKKNSGETFTESNSAEIPTEEGSSMLTNPMDIFN